MVCNIFSNSLLVFKFFFFVFQAELSVFPPPPLPSFLRLACLQLGLNDDASSMASMSPMGSVSSFGGSSVAGSKEERARERRRKDELRAKLAGLPSPQYEYELVAPEVGWFAFGLLP